MFSISVGLSALVRLIVTLDCIYQAFLGAEQCKRELPNSSDTHLSSEKQGISDIFVDFQVCVGCFVPFWRELV